MPYSPEDATRFTRKADTSKKRRQWADVFSSVTKRGGSEGSAITQANGVIKRNKLRSRKGPQRRGRIRM